MNGSPSHRSPSPSQGEGLGRGFEPGPAAARIRDLLARHHRLTFARFMHEALHGPDGYYTLRPRLGGADADFFTSPELHPVFGALLGRLAHRIWHALGQPGQFEVVEHGPGTGALCRDLLDWADHEAPAFAATVRYVLVEQSDVLRSVQQSTLLTAGLNSERVNWREPETDLTPSPTLDGCTGLILANELIDALPVHLVTVRDGTLLERYVVQDGDGFAWLDEAPSTDDLAAYFDRLGLRPADGCIAEVNLVGIDWMDRTATALDRGALLVLDYGYPASELYAASRRTGTLLTYRQHTLGSDPLRHVGDQDITAHVDFTSLARAGERHGLETVGLISQSSLMRQLGWDEYVRRLDRSSVAAGDHDANRRAMQTLLDPDGLGRIQGLLQTRGLDQFDPFAGPQAQTEDARWAAPTSWLPLLWPGQMRLPGPLEAEGFTDLEAQWRELFTDDDS
jgi:SAM-dependent MidA family methyltransferase